MSSDGPPRGALDLGADYRGLGVARSLGRRGVPVWVVAEGGEPLATVSRYARRSLRWPEHEAPSRVDFLLELAASRGLQGWALIPSGDSTAAMIARHHAALEPAYAMTTPAW